jgi:heme/copper-type cytochrome/quinol oxidase subunit 1
MRLEINSSSIRLLTYENQQFFYYISITLHGLIMIFFLIMPFLYSGIGNIFIPINLGVTDVAYPRINNISILLIPLTYTLVGLTLIIEFSIGTGWTLYPPLST